MKRFIAVLTVFLALVAGLNAGDTYNQSVTVVENHDQVVVTFDAAMGSDSTGSLHSYPIYIGDCNDADAYITAITNAASDINVLFHLSRERRTWTAVTAADLDACSNTAKEDTLGIGDSGSSKFHEMRWLVIEKDGQTGANQADALYLTITFEKDVSPVDANGNVVPVCRIARSSVSNP